MQSIIIKEIISAVSDKRLLILKVIIMPLVFAAFLSGYNRFVSLDAGRMELNEAFRKNRETQEEKAPAVQLITAHLFIHHSLP